MIFFFYLIIAVNHKVFNHCKTKSPLTFTLYPEVIGGVFLLKYSQKFRLKCMVAVPGMPKLLLCHVSKIISSIMGAWSVTYKY